MALGFAGESTVDFLFDFVEMSQGPVEAFAALETRPRSGNEIWEGAECVDGTIVSDSALAFPLGVNVSLLLTASGNDSITLTEVSLVKLLGTEEVTGTVTPQESGSFLVVFQAPPSDEFLVRVRGRHHGVSGRASANFQRVTSTSFRSSNLTITVSSCRHEEASLAACSTPAHAAFPLLSRPMPTESLRPERPSPSPSL